MSLVSTLISPVAKSYATVILGQRLLRQALISTWVLALLADTWVLKLGNMRYRLGNGTLVNAKRFND